MNYEKVVLSDGLLRQLVHFSGITELLDAADEGIEKETWRIYSKEYLKGDWAHGSLQNVAGTSRCLRFSEPPAHVVAKAEAFKEALMASEAYRHASEKAQSTKRRRVFELDGAELDIDRYLGQQDECWGRVTRGLQRPVVRLAVNLLASAGNDEATFAGVAALGTCCAVLAEQAGCSLEILCILSAHQVKHEPATKEGCAVFPVKHADEPFHQNSLLCVGMPGLSRHYWFNIAHNLLQGRTDPLQGRAMPVTKELREHLGVQHVLEVAWKNNQQMAFLDDFVKTLHDA